MLLDIGGASSFRFCCGFDTSLLHIMLAGVGCTAITGFLGVLGASGRSVCYGGVEHEGRSARFQDHDMAFVSQLDRILSCLFLPVLVCGRPVSPPLASGLCSQSIRTPCPCSPSLCRISHLIPSLPALVMPGSRHVPSLDPQQIRLDPLEHRLHFLQEVLELDSQQLLRWIVNLLVHELAELLMNFLKEVFGLVCERFVLGVRGNIECVLQLLGH